jgi:iron(III) transport system substrate-binding protein
LQKYGAGFLQRLGAQARFAPDGSTGIQAVGSGSADLYAPAVPPLTAALKASGMHIGATYLQLNVSSDVLAAGVKGSPHQCAGQLMLDYLMSKDGQASLNKGGYSLLPGVAGTQPVPSYVESGDPGGATKDADQIVSLLTSH